MWSSRPYLAQRAVKNAFHLDYQPVWNYYFQNIMGNPKAPPASKEVVASLPVVTVTEEIIAKLGSETQCAVCRENLAVDDKMQELPCKHLFHPPCLKPWLDENNSCPICRNELRTDDHVYESRKEREREEEEDRKGAANAVRGGGVHVCLNLNWLEDHPLSEKKRRSFVTFKMHLLIMLPFCDNDM
ncbi:hypothetical protein GUJ93_ZPchr0009g1214 [Zizania palustris]|uniref:RING-type E3 ubiquitin transferase n=1 Tax=Zizania palustris TaxID=103762 RepID=A0A8J5S3D8_ZIZPA|nr:hypothetical protein GUJ93_ZPchr0009g1214 [Zizania palustris]